jgi:hypothetical protein
VRGAVGLGGAVVLGVGHVFQLPVAVPGVTPSGPSLPALSAGCHDLACERVGS